MLELCDGEDLLIHDAQHAAAEFEQQRHWGHCTSGYAVHVAKQSGTRLLALFHHDPAHSDDDVYTMLRDARDVSDHLNGAEVVAASEGMVLRFPPT